MDEASIIARIDALLRSQPPPPPEVLQQVVKILRKARGGTSQEIVPATSTACTSSMASSATSAGDELLATKASFSRSSHVERATVAIASDAVEDVWQLGRPNPAHARCLARHAKVHDEGVPKHVDIRERKTRQYQALLEGRGGKYLHADYVPAGATQIAGAVSHTPSLTAGGGAK